VQDRACLDVPRLDWTWQDLPATPHLTLTRYALARLDLPAPTRQTKPRQTLPILPYHDPRQPDGHPAPRQSISKLQCQLIDGLEQVGKLVQVVIALLPSDQLLQRAL
jgi:hypothetical protein